MPRCELKRTVLTGVAEAISKGQSSFYSDEGAWGSGTGAGDLIELDLRSCYKSREFETLGGVQRRE